VANKADREGEREKNMQGRRMCMVQKTSLHMHPLYVKYIQC